MTKRKTSKKPIGILVLGMHRSGTSALTRMLNLLGCALSDDLLGANRGNPEGHWESLRSIEINDTLLAALGRRWDDIRELPADWMTRPETDQARAQIRAFLDGEFGATRLWVLKDPRLCRLAPLWLEMMAEAGIDARVVIALRHPAEVAYSLARRDGIAPGRSHLLWLQHVLEAERASRGRPRALVHYQDLLANWRVQGARLATTLGVRWPVTVNKAAPAIDAFLRPDLRHADVAEARDGAARIEVPPPVVAVHRALLEGGGDEAAWTGVQRVAARLAQAGAVYAPGIADLAVRAERSEQRAAAAQLADPEAMQRSAELLERLREETQQAFAKLDQAGPLLVELIRQIEAQRGQLQALPASASTEGLAQLREQSVQLAATIERQGPLLVEVIRQVEAQRGQLQALPKSTPTEALGQLSEQSSQLAAMLDKHGPLLAELVHQVEAQGARLEALPEPPTEVLGQLREQSGHLTATLERQGPLLVEVIAQVEAQRSELQAAQSRLGSGIEGLLARAPALSPEQAQLLEVLSTQGREVADRLESQAALLSGLIEGVEAQRLALGGQDPVAALLAHDELLTSLRDETRLAYAKFDQSPPLLAELVAQIEAQRQWLQGQAERLADAPVVQESMRRLAALGEQLEAQRADLGPALHQAVSLLGKVQDESRQAFARLERAPGAEAQLEQLAALREQGRQLAARIDDGAPALAALARQLDAQRDAIESVPARWVRTPLVQEMLRLVGLLHEQGGSAAAHMASAQARIDALAQQFEGLGARLEGSPGAQAQARQLEALHRDTQDIAARLDETAPRFAQLREDTQHIAARLEENAPRFAQLDRLREDTQHIAARLEENAPRFAQLDRLREDTDGIAARLDHATRDITARLDESAPQLAELVRQIDAQRGQIEGVAARWSDSPAVQASLRLVAQVHEQGQAALMRLDETAPRIDRLTEQALAHGRQLEKLTEAWLQAQHAGDLAQQEQALATRQAQTQAEANANALRTAVASLEASLLDLRQVRDRELARAAASDEALTAAHGRLDEVVVQLDALGTMVQQRDAELADRAGAFATLQTYTTKLEGARRDLAMQLHVAWAKIFDLEEQQREQAQRLRENDEEFDRVFASHSWRLTAPLRAIRRALSQPVTQTVAQAGGGVLRVGYRTLPLPWSARLRLKSAIFRAFAPLLRHTQAWQRWDAQRQDDAHPALAGPWSAPVPMAPPPVFATAPEAEAPVAHEVHEAPVARDVEPAPMPAPAPVVPLDGYVPMVGEPAALEELRAKVIAFYLPQFHPIPENDEWWGRGFTEWTNVSKALPRFEGHDQPHLPGELGFYDLRLPEVMHRQVELARHYGVQGFCFHYYWFDGRRILERPLNQYLGNPALDLPFCVCWANENWTRRWDGADHDVLLGQNHTPESDLRFIVDLEPVLRDPRYIRVDGRPLLIVYRPSLLPDCPATVERWREHCRSVGIGELFLVMVQFDAEDPRPLGFDAAVEFPPHKLARDLPAINHTLPRLDPGFEGHVIDYNSVVERSRNWPAQDFDLIRGVFPGWDNEARKPNKGYLFAHNSPERYRDWLAFAVDYSRHYPVRGESLVFVNAWNEWAEGAYLEPDRTHGYAYLQATRDAVTGRAPLLPFAGDPAPATEAPVATPEPAAEAPSPAEATSAGPAPGGKPKVIVVSHDAHPHGAQYLALNITREALALGCEVTMVVLGDGVLMADYQAMVRVFQVERGDEAGRAELARRLVAEGYRAAIANTTVSGQFVADLQRAGCRVVSLVHELPGVITDYGLLPHVADIATHAHHVVFAADAVRSGFESFVPLPAHKTVIRAQGLYKRNRFRATHETSGSRRRLRERLGLQESAQVVLGVGYADLRKGIDLFVEAGDQVMRNNPNAHFVWLGHWDLQLEPSIRARVAASPHAGNFHFPGRHPDTDDFYAGADVLALTSREDPFPSVVMESLDVAVPIVAFRGAGGFESLLERAGGRLVEHGNASAFAMAVDAWLGNEGERRKVGAAGKAVVDAEFSFRAYLFDLLAYAGIDLPRVSVVVPNYNYAHLLRERIGSIVAQTVAPYEIIVLDDASTDDSAQVIAELLGQHDLRVVANTTNSGSVFMQWHRGVELARGHFVWIAEADDLSAPTFLETVLAGMRHDGVKMSYCQSRQMDVDGRILCDNYLDYTNGVSESHWLAPYVESGIEEIRSYLSVKNTIPNVSAALFRRKELFRVLDESLDDIVEFRVAGDWMVYLKVLETGRVAFSPQPLNDHRRHGGSVTVGTHQLSHLLEVLAVQRWIKRRHGLDESLVRKCRDYAQQLYEYFGLPAERFERAELDPVVSSMMVYTDAGRDN